MCAAPSVPHPGRRDAADDLASRTRIGRVRIGRVRTKPHHGWVGLNHRRRTLFRKRSAGHAASTVMPAACPLLMGGGYPRRLSEFVLFASRRDPAPVFRTALIRYLPIACRYSCASWSALGWVRS